MNAPLATGKPDISIEELVSPTGQDLQLVLFLAKEGLSSKCDIFEGVMHYKEWTANFGVEANSDKLNERYKNQRDVDEPRVRRLEKYFDREDHSLPSINIFVTQLEINEHVTVGNRPMVIATLRADSKRLVSDGQGRTETVRRLLADRTDLMDHTIGFKLLVTNTKTLWDARQIIRQHFADLNGTSSKPNTSISLLFDQSKPYGRIMNQLLEVPISSNDNKPLIELIALHGKIRQGNLWTYTQFVSFVRVFFGASAAVLNKTLDNHEAETLFMHRATVFVQVVFNALPLSSLHDESWRTIHQQSLFTKALFAKALALTAKSLVDDHVAKMLRGKIEDGTPVDWSPLSDLPSLPIDDMMNELWISNNVCLKSEDGKVNILKNSDKRIARVLCHHLDIKPSLSI